MSRKDDQIAELELERVTLRSDVRDLERQREIFVAMLIRAAREIPEPRLRAGFLEELETLVPGALDEVSADQRPDALRRRLA